MRTEAVNHGIGGTSTDAGYRGDGEPNALAMWKGVTRFEAEVLGLGGPDWDAGTGKPSVYLKNYSGKFAEFNAVIEIQVQRSLTRT